MLSDYESSQVAQMGDMGSPGEHDMISPVNAGDMGSSPGLRKSPGEGNGDPLQFSCLENPIDRGV